MAIQVVTQANPPAGTDWKFTVPGQWLPYLYGVTAVLNTGGDPTTIPDETGHGHDLSIQNAQSHYTFGATGPFAGGALNTCVVGDGANIIPNYLARGPATTAFSTAAVSVEFWELLPVLGLAFRFSIASANNTNGTSPSVQVDGLDSATPPDRLIVDTGVTTITFLGGGVTDTAWHHRVVTGDGTNWKVFIDGALADTEPGPVNGVGTSKFPTLPGGPQNRGLFGSLAGVAFYTSAISGTQIAMHAAANGSSGAYRAAVLADAPEGFWLLNGTRPGPSRLVDLRVTDGTNVVAEFPAAVAATIAPDFTYSWQSLGAAIATTTDNSVVTVPIPELSISPGYTIGTATLDLAPTDQWSQIRLWFDDGTGPGGTGPGGTGGVDYLDARFVPDMPNG